MKKLSFLLVFLLACSLAFAQDNFDQIINQGVALHDKGDFEGAIRKYNKVLTKEPNHFMANYEKGYTLLMLKRYDECIAINKMLAEKYPDHDEAKNVYVNWGSAEDDKGDHEEAIRVYDKGITAFPDFYLLYYNKALTYVRMNDRVNSVHSAEDALSKRPLHASSHNLLGLLMRDINMIPSLLSSLTFLSIESSGKRAEANLQQVEELLMLHVKKTGKNSVQLNLSPDLLDTNRSNKENDFRSIELVVSLGGALDEDKKYKSETKAERLQRKLESIIEMLDDKTSRSKGFFWTFYAPFFVEMKARKQVEAFSHIAYQSANDDDNNKWLVKNEDKIKDFYVWLKNYAWNI